MANTIHCPSCQRELRVPDELIGKKVKCPACSQTFTATAAGPEAAPPVPGGPSVMEPVSSQPQPAPRDQYEEVPGEYADQLARERMSRSRERALSALRPPAICLLVTGILGFLVCVLAVVSSAMSNPQQMKEQAKNFPPGVIRDAFEKSADFEASGMALILRLAVLLLNVVVIVGAIMMMLGRMYWLAMTASILAMLDFQGCCCLLGIPFGIWSIVVMSRSDVKSAFS